MNQQLKAARFLNKTNPKRYFFERDGCVVRLFDKKSGFMTHSRLGSSSTVICGVFGRPPLFEYVETNFS